MLFKFPRSQWVNEMEPWSHVLHYSDVINADQRKHQSSASLAFVRGIHRWPVNSRHKWPVTRKMFPFDDVIIFTIFSGASTSQLCTVLVGYVSPASNPGDVMSYPDAVMLSDAWRSWRYSRMTSDIRMSLTSSPYRRSILLVDVMGLL